MSATTGHGDSGEPPAPHGPGVVPPFTVPPNDRDNTRLWIGLGAGLLALALCCVGGVAGGGVLLAGASKQVEVEAKDSLDSYLEALEHEEYDDAYHLRCPALTRGESLSAFTQRAREDRVLSYHLEGATFDSNEIRVTAVVRSRVRGTSEREYLMVAGTGQMMVCGER